MCIQHKSDSTKKNVDCVDNTITFTFKDDFSGYDLSQLGRKLLYECDLITSKPSYSCAWWVNYHVSKLGFEPGFGTPQLHVATYMGLQLMFGYLVGNLRLENRFTQGWKISLQTS